MLGVTSRVLFSQTENSTRTTERSVLVCMDQAGFTEDASGVAGCTSALATRRRLRQAAHNVLGRGTRSVLCEPGLHGSSSLALHVT